MSARAAPMDMDTTKLVVPFRLRIKEQEKVGWLVGRGLPSRLRGAQCV
jgi:hypothetical protein